MPFDGRRRRAPGARADLMWLREQSKGFDRSSPDHPRQTVTCCAKVDAESNVLSGTNVSAGHEAGAAQARWSDTRGEVSRMAPSWGERRRRAAYEPRASLRARCSSARSTSSRRRSCSSFSFRCSLLVALAIKLDSPGPLFFRSTRVGYRRPQARDAQVPEDETGRRRTRRHCRRRRPADERRSRARAVPDRRAAAALACAAPER